MCSEVYREAAVPEMLGELVPGHHGQRPVKKMAMRGSFKTGILFNDHDIIFTVDVVSLPGVSGAFCYVGSRHMLMSMSKTREPGHGLLAFQRW